MTNIANYIEINWDGSSSNYVIYKNNDSIALTNVNQFKDSNVLDGNNYCYKIQAIEDICQSDTSAEACLVFIGIEEENYSELKINIYPNPAKDRLNITLTGNSIPMDLEIYDIRGRLIRKINLKPNQTQIEIDLIGMSNGVYNLRAVSKGVIINKKVIIQ